MVEEILRLLTSGVSEPLVRVLVVSLDSVELNKASVRQCFT